MQAGQGHARLQNPTLSYQSAESLLTLYIDL